jgi:PAS domain-containing protein
MAQKKKPVVASKTTKPKRKQPLAVGIEPRQYQEDPKLINEKLVRLQVELEAAFRQYTDLYDFAPVGYFTLGRDGTIRQVNLAGANLLGVEHGRLINQRLGLFVTEESRPVLSAFLEELLSGEDKKKCEVIIEKK